MSERVPPRVVPTLTEVVQPAPPARAASTDDAGAVPALLAEELARRIMQRVGAGLDQRVREAVAQVVVEYANAMAPRLREEVEAVVREAVAQALAQELPR